MSQGLLNLKDEVWTLANKKKIKGSSLIHVVLALIAYIHDASTCCWQLWLHLSAKFINIEADRD